MSRTPALAHCALLSAPKKLFTPEHFVAYRSPSSRVGWTSFAAATCAAIASLLSGCQSGAQSDQVARELRMQEDQLYAMEDYLEQYQKLVCKYRAENAALKQQLAENGDAPATSRPSNGSRPTPTGPSIDVPPPANGTTPPTDIDSPDIPPLDTTTSGRANARRAKTRGKVKLTAAQGPEGDSAAEQAIALAPVDKAPVASEVWLHGEVVANELGGGPRILVEVEPLDAKGRATAFNGALSLMLMAPNKEGKTEPVARWDYRPQDVRAALGDDGNGKTIRFHLELPPETPIAEGTELWVRLLQRRGAKLLAHAPIQLHEPSLFSSRSEVGPKNDASSHLGPDPESTAAGKDENPDSGRPHVKETISGGVASVNSEISDGGWTIARPGRPAGVAEAGVAESNDWRATLEPPPSVMASGATAKPKPRIRRPPESTQARNGASARTLKRSPWSPERTPGTPGNESRTATRPTWSATR
jgi:hypothetical protein